MGKPRRTPSNLEKTAENPKILIHDFTADSGVWVAQQIANFIKESAHENLPLIFIEKDPSKNIQYKALTQAITKIMKAPCDLQYILERKPPNNSVNLLILNRVSPTNCTPHCLPKRTWTDENIHLSSRTRSGIHIHLSSRT